MLLKLAKETIGFGTRLAGEQMRRKCKTLLVGEATLPLVLDWDGVQVITSSYADEFIGKLFIDLGPMTFMARVRQLNHTALVQSLIDRAILQRTRLAFPKT